jgi:hypothetical protein
MSASGPVVFAFGACAQCGRLFSFNPNFVPSLRMRDGKPDPTGPREPFCRSCIEAANIIRKKNGVTPHVIHPQAYEPLPEDDL